MKPFSLSLTAKIVLLVASTGMACAMLTLYATWNMQRIEAQYHTLLQSQASTVNQVARVRQSLSDASALVNAVLTLHNEEQMLLAQERLTQIQKSFEVNLDAMYVLLGEHSLALDVVRTQSQHMFATGQRVVSANLSWRNDRALQVLAQSFSPALEKLQNDVDALKALTHTSFELASANLAAQTQATIRHTNWAGAWSVVLISAIAAWLAWFQISRPIGRLTQSMQRMRQQQYGMPIADQTRGDEIGCMARTLKGFDTSLHEAAQLEETLLQHKKRQLLMEQLQQLTCALPGAVFQMRLAPGLPLKLSFVSPQWTQLMGLPADTDPSVENASQLIRAHDTEVTRISEQHYLHSAETLKPIDFSIQMHMRDGVKRWIKTRATPHPESDGSITFYGVWLDVTQELMQARALEKAKRQAEQSATEKTLLQASISHEIRTPLNAILGMTQLLLKADLPEVQREQLHNVLRASEHLRGIVNEVLDFTKIDAGQLQLESTDFSLESVVLDVLGMCNEEASKKGLALHYKMAREVPDSLRGDPHRIAQILLNYVNNAIKFTTSGDIHIALRLDASSTLHRVVLHVSVKDTGPGIPADRIPLLFQAFQQADNSITRRFGGTGLGLTISRALAQLMGGSAGVHSTLGQGSTFWFTAVMEPARTAVPRHQATLQAPPVMTTEWQGLRILVVDDNPLNRAVAEGMLHALGLQTEVAEDGAQALLHLQSVGPHYFSCVLMDLQMPHMDGISATKALRQLPGFAHLPIIAMTAYTGVQDEQRTQAAGMNAHLSKPLLESALHDVLQAWLGSHPQHARTNGAATPEVPATEPEFDASAIDALAQLFDATKLQQLVAQFSQDSLQRARQLPALAQQQDWTSMRAEAHKLTGTAATFGLLRLGQLSSALSSALKAADNALAVDLAQQVATSAHNGVAQLQAYCPTTPPPA
jgi:signal transduction histidine kinase/DNA-binding response OmpR family regulator/HAMP domain-containing protein